MLAATFPVAPTVSTLTPHNSYTNHGKATGNVCKHSATLSRHAKFLRDTVSHFLFMMERDNHSSRGPKVKLDPKLTLTPWLLNKVKIKKKMKMCGVLEKLHKNLFLAYLLVVYFIQTSICCYYVSQNLIKIA